MLFLLSSAPLASEIYQNNKATFIVISLFAFLITFSLSYIQNFSSIQYTMAITSISSNQLLQQNSQQDLNSSINNQTTQQPFANTINSNNNNNNNYPKIDTNTNYNITDSKNIQNNILITKMLAKNLENHIQKAGSILYHLAYVFKPPLTDSFSY